LAIVMSATGRDARSVQNAFRHRIFGPVADVLTFYRTTMIDRALDWPGQTAERRARLDPAGHEHTLMAISTQCV